MHARNRCHDLEGRDNSIPWIDSNPWEHRCDSVNWVKTLKSRMAIWWALFLVNLRGIHTTTRSPRIKFKLELHLAGSNPVLSHCKWPDWIGGHNSHHVIWFWPSCYYIGPIWFGHWDIPMDGITVMLWTSWPLRDYTLQKNLICSLNTYNYNTSWFQLRTMVVGTISSFLFGYEMKLKSALTNLHPHYHVFVLWAWTILLGEKKGTFC